jgi:predicted protein tyrosine phosphatase
MSNIPTNTKESEKMETSLIALPTVRNLQEARSQCFEYDAVITAGPYKDEVRDFGHPMHKVVEFRDTMFEENGGPTFENVVELVEFGAGIPKLLVHCHAGISRSTATAWGVAIANGHDPLDAFLTLQNNHPSEHSLFRGFRRTFAPNILIVKHLDKYFNLGTTLLEIRNKYSEIGW